MSKQETIEEKAQDLLNKMLSKNPNIQDGISSIDTIQAKLCALVVVDEILDLDGYRDGFNNDYWQEVKQEIEKL